MKQNDDIIMIIQYCFSGVFSTKNSKALVPYYSSSKIGIHFLDITQNQQKFQYKV